MMTFIYGWLMGAGTVWILAREWRRWAGLRCRGDRLFSKYRKKQLELALSGERRWMR